MFHVFLSVVVQAWMVDCPHCHTYAGAPTCSSCKTYFRVGALLQSGKLSKYQEGSVLTALRNCAGALSDLVEIGVAGPFGQTVGSGNLGGEGEIGRSPLKETEKKEEEQTKEEPKKSEKKAKVPGREGKKTKRKDKASKRKSRSKSQDKREERPKKKSNVERGEALEATGSERRHKEDERSRSRRSPRRREKSEDARREGVDREVERYPARFGLERVPIRGSAGGRAHEGPIPARRLPPPEPRRSPQRSYWQDRDYNRGYGDGSQKDPNRWKGYNHYLRGVNYWKGKRRPYK